MEDISIREKCRINTNYTDDTFVGIKCTNGDISINFPLGFEISRNDKDLRKDIIMLLSVLANNISRTDSEILGQARLYDLVQFPMQAYMYVVSDFIARGYYTELEINYKVAKKGKIDWSRTIKTQKSYICHDNIFYLDYMTKSKNHNENELITLIHEFCVYDSFCKIGWLFTNHVPKKASIKFNKKLFISVLKNKLTITFNDRNRQLLISMLAIVNCMGDTSASTNFQYGTYRFEYVWERMIDKVFGITYKSDFFPKTSWKLTDVTYSNASLEPDTIMIYNNDIYVLDAKYYKFGVTNKPNDLPESTSINKQITYGEYIYYNKELKSLYGDCKVFNAFILPYNSSNNKFGSKKEMISIGEAVSNWKNNDIEYQRVIGILLDVKYLMSINVRLENTEIDKLAKLIKSTINFDKDSISY